MFPYLVRRSWNLLFRRVYECSKKQESTVLRVLNLLVPVCLYIFSNGIQSFTNGSRIAKSQAAGVTFPAIINKFVVETHRCIFPSSICLTKR